MPPTTLTDLPPELVDHITTYLPAAGSLAQLSSTNKYIKKCIEPDGWSTFNRTQFPSLAPQSTASPKDTARTLTTWSRAWDRRAFVARALEPHGRITAFPGALKVERWKRPRGQTIGFTPHVDVVEDVGTGWRQRKERALTKAEMISRLYTYSGMTGGSRIVNISVVVGTANGDLKLVKFLGGESKDPSASYFVTQGQPVRSSSVLERSDGSALLAASMGDSRVSIYPVSPSSSKIAPLCSIDIRPDQAETISSKNHRVWSTAFLSQQHIAVGLGPSDHPLSIYALTPTGLCEKPVREFGLPNVVDDLVEGSVPLAASFAKNITSSVYPIVTLPPSFAAGGHGNIFLSGAYDGIVRLHDLRSSSDVEQAYVDPSDDSAIYSLLPRGQENILAGTARHSLLKVFDLRLGAKAYSYLDTAPVDHKTRTDIGSAKGDWNLFLRPSMHQQSQHGRGPGRYRSSETSVYSIAAPSPSSPYIYAGVENSVLELAFTGVLDKHSDPIFSNYAFLSPKNAEDAQRNRQVVDLAMYDQTFSSPKLYTQKSLWETARTSRRGSAVAHTLDFPPAAPGLDERWKLGGS
nr:hypothetical protein CFP56_37238 [Quercus suber]